MIFNEDDRAQRLLDVFEILPGQVNVSYVNSTNHIVAWHKHHQQTDYWVCLRGAFKIGLAILNAKNQYEVHWEYLSDKNPRVLKIPPETYHGYKALQPDSILLYYVDKKYNPADEIRAEVGHFGETWEVKNK